MRVTASITFKLMSGKELDPTVLNESVKKSVESYLRDDPIFIYQDGEVIGYATLQSPQVSLDA